MRSFTDSEKRVWHVSVNITSAKRVRALAGVDLVARDVGATLDRILADMVLLVDALYAICKPQADELKVSDEDFGRAMAGDAIATGAEVLLAELADFTPNPRDRERVRKVLAKMKEVGELARDLVEAEVDKALAAAPTSLTISGPTSGVSPGVSG